MRTALRSPPSAHHSFDSSGNAGGIVLHPPRRDDRRACQQQPYCLNPNLYTIFNAVLIDDWSVAEQLVSFHRVISQLLADVQERLVYRAHIYVQNDILGYKPVGGDLAYPEKLEMMESIAESLQNQSPRLGRSESAASVSSQDTVRSHTGSKSHPSYFVDSFPQLPSNSLDWCCLDSPADLHGMWYPPLRRALLCLSKLYRSVDRSTFQGLSQVCCQSVKNWFFHLSVPRLFSVFCHCFDFVLCVCV